MVLYVIYGSSWLIIIFPIQITIECGSTVHFPSFFFKETICQAKADKVPQPEPFGDPTTVMLRHIPNRSDPRRAQGSLRSLHRASKGNQEARSF